MTEDSKKIIFEVDDLENDDEISLTAYMRVLVFFVGQEQYCVDIKDAKEVIKVEHVTHVPGVPNFVLGVMNLRGEVITLCDLCSFLTLDASERPKELWALVTDVLGAPMALLVDEVKGAIDIEERLIQPPLATLGTKMSQYTRGQAQVGGEILIFLDLKKILTCEEMEHLKKG